MTIGLDKNNLEQIIKIYPVVLVCFKAPWCIHCKHQKEVIDRIHKIYESKVVFAYIDTDKNEDLVDQFGIKNLPTMLLFKKGNIEKKVEYFMQEEQITTLLKEFI